MPMSTVYNLERWTSALRDIYVKVRLGLNKTAATEAIVGDWTAAEKYNFSNWMKYYESGEVYKYKTAQNSYYSEEGNYYMPNPPGAKHPVPSPIKSINDIAQEANYVADGFQPGLQKADEDAANEAFRKVLLGRLNSIEKHLNTQRGYLFSGKDYKSLLKSVHDLKMMISTQGRLALSARTCVDLLIKHAGILQRKNCMVGADIMIKLAQQTPGNTGDLAMGQTPVGGSIPQGLGNLGAPMPNLNPVPPGAAEPEEAPLTGIDGFIDNTKGAGITDGAKINKEELNNDDSPEDEVVMDEDEVEVEAFVDFSDDELVVTGQDARLTKENLPNKIQKEKRPDGENPTAKPTSSKGLKEVAPASDFDALVNSAFDKLTMEDLLAKLQDINLIFKRKEINRQLALADLMLSRLGLTPYFSNFSEVQQKNLDCLNYSATRMDDIISTLQSGLGKGKIDLTRNQEETDPEAQLLQRHLESEEKKEEDRKEMRKEVNNKKLQLEDTDKPEIEVESPGAELAEAPLEPKRPAVPAPKPKALVPPGA